MATEQELLDDAAANARATTITWDEFLELVSTRVGFDYRSTAWYAAGADLEELKSVPTTPRPLPPAPAPRISSAQARIFLAQSPLDCLAAPSWMVPVCTADAGYREWYTPEVIAQLRARFGVVEAWCDCRPAGAGTPYSNALAMVDELGLDGAWGQCETTAEFDAAYEAGARRMVGSINAQVLDDTRLAKVASGEVLVSVELYRNLQPGLLPDWRNANAGIGGNCIACYASDTEGAVRTPVASYRELGHYVPKRDSVYGVGLSADDWQALA
jgi:hypothetical protein